MSEGPGFQKSSFRQVWVFGVDLTEPEARALLEYPDEDSRSPLEELLGVSFLDEDFIEIFDAKWLASYGFAHYLTEANGMSEDSVSPDAARLDALEGTVLLVFPQALREGATMEPRYPLQFVGSYLEAMEIRVPEPMPTESAKGVLEGPAGKPRPSDAAILGRVATAALIFLFALVLLMVWVAG